jgi:hypothetical protein
VRRLLIATTAGLTVFGATFAAATNLTVAAAPVGAGAGSVSSCDTDGVTTSYTTGFDATAGYTVTAVAVAGIAAACNGQSVRVTLVNGSGASVGTGNAVTISGTSASVPMTGTVAASSVQSVHVVIV